LKDLKLSGSQNLYENYKWVLKFEVGGSIKPPIPNLRTQTTAFIYPHLELIIEPLKITLEMNPKLLCELET